ISETSESQAAMPIEGFAFEQRTAKFALSMAVTQSAQRLSAALEYNTDLFEASTIQHLFRHWLTILEGIVAQPEQRLSALPLLTEAEHKLMATEWNATQIPYSQDLCLHQLVEQQARRSPDAIAVMYEEEQLTYHELNRRADQLALYLRQQGIRQEIVVGICLERTPMLLVALLAVLKAGGAYLPLDPAYPADRLTYMLQDSRAVMLLSQARLREYFPAHLSVLCLDEGELPLGQDMPFSSTDAISGEQLAYIIYTSGSTGRPKGVAIIHSNAVAFLTWASTTFRAQSQSVLASTSICFDLAVFEVFGPLCWGGRVLLVENILLTPSYIWEAGVDLLNTVPSAIGPLLQQRELPSSLRTVNLAGEPVSSRLVQELYAQPELKHLYNLYGPTETTTYSTMSLLTTEEKRTPPIGRPIGNTRVYVLSRTGQMQPAGVPGELFIGGAGVARGYLNRPDLTAERFVPDPFGTQEGSRLYRTGDIVRYRSDGTLEFLGRQDSQVKLRGFRIEPGEVEHVLQEHPAVRECVVLMREGGSEGNCLVAYVSGNQQAELSSDNLRAYVREKLPEYMVPAFILNIESLPLTANGKVDRHVLASLPLYAEPSSFVAPRDELEHQLREIWEEILDISPISVVDNFFDLGGHSILALKLLSRVKTTFGRDIPLAALFHYQTVGELGALLREQLPRKQYPIVVPLQPHGNRIPFFCIHPGGGSVFSYRSLAQRVGGVEQPFYGVQMPDPQEYYEEFR
ncbi:MAG TPA: amino acid adenylation domain-containing protein, partial [Ktedonobacteraceae bacterium]|nr:amino acid adenylation domain-containing protein [Ktedonobacteraceae bacterium]